MKEHFWQQLCVFVEDLPKAQSQFYFVLRSQDSNHTQREMLPRVGSWGQLGLLSGRKLCPAFSSQAQNRHMES